ncbi:MAG TPA: hypothetical protein VFP71_02250 [Candidatus Angelobacter sp.]|nr:hypothetical protein [Candidatus Angelobacter sp.]
MAILLQRFRFIPDYDNNLDWKMNFWVKPLHASSEIGFAGNKVRTTLLPPEQQLVCKRTSPAIRIKRSYLLALLPVLGFPKILEFTL